MTLDAQILRRIRVSCARIRANAGKYFDIIAVDQAQPAFCIQSHELLDIFRIDAAMNSTLLPCFPGVIAELLLLNPNDRFRKKSDPTHMIPVGVADHDVRHLFRPYSRELYRFIRPE